MAITYLTGGVGAITKNILRFVADMPLDGRVVVDTYSDISGDNYKSLFSNVVDGKTLPSYYTGMLVVTKDTGKLYVLASDGLFKEVTPDLSNIYGSITAKNYTAAKALAKSNNIGQIIYVTEEETSTTEKDEEGEFIVYSVGPYVVTGEGTIAKLGTTSASGDLAGDVESLKGSVSTIQTVLTNELPIVLTIDTSFSDMAENNTYVQVSPDEFFANNSLRVPYFEFFTDDNKLRLVIKDVNGDLVQFNNIEGNDSLCGTFEYNGGHYMLKCNLGDENVSLYAAAFDTHYDLATKGELSNLADTVSKLPTFDVVVYTPSEGAEFPAEPKEDTLYLIPDGTESNDVYREWIYVNNSWEKLGVHSLDVNAISEALEEKVDKVDGKELISSTLIPQVESVIEIVGTTSLTPSDSLITEGMTLVEATETLVEKVELLSSFDYVGTTSVLTPVSSTNSKEYLKASTTIDESGLVSTLELTPVLCAIEDATSEISGIADAYNVQQYIQNALEWNEVTA